METKFLINLQLKEGASPHLYVDTIKAMIAENTSLHPQMRKTLQLLKKANQPFVLLATRKEIIFDLDNFRHFERAVAPKETGWLKTYWSPEEKESCQNNPQKHVKNILNSFKDLGYEFFDPKSVPDVMIDSLETLTK